MHSWDVLCKNCDKLKWIDIAEIDYISWKRQEHTTQLVTSNKGCSKISNKKSLFTDSTRMHSSLIPSEKWAWHKRNYIYPITMMQPVAPNNVLKITCSSCKWWCQAACGCRKSSFLAHLPAVYAVEMIAIITHYLKRMKF